MLFVTIDEFSARFKKITSMMVSHELTVKLFIFNVFILTP